MYAAIAFALLTVASAQYSTYTGYGVNAPLNQYPVPTLSHNAAAVHYASPIQKVVSPAVYGANFYGAQKVVSPFGVEKVVAPFAQKVVSPYGVAAKVVAPHAYGYADGQVQRDYDIEQIGERYAINSGLGSLQYSFVRGVDAAPHGIAAKVVSPVNYGYGYGQKVVSPVGYGVASYGVPHEARYDTGYYGSALRTGPVVQKVSPFAVKQLIK